MVRPQPSNQTISIMLRHLQRQLSTVKFPKTNNDQGASAVLCYGAIDAPLAQPRALIFGHFLSALVGICITKLFSLMPDEERFNSLRWLAASLSSAVAIVVMQVTQTTHPPAGATALLPAVDDAIWELSWYYLPVVLLSSVIIMAVAMLLNNIQRRYPTFWIAPSPPPKPAPPPVTAPEHQKEHAEEELGWVFFFFLFFFFLLWFGHKL